MGCRFRAAHPTIREVAKEMAGVVYEQHARNNLWFAMNPSQKAFINLVAPSLIDQARMTLGEALGRADVADDVKAEIAEVLFADATLQFGRTTRTRVLAS
jgi:hypothetical protein